MLKLKEKQALSFIRMKHRDTWLIPTMRELQDELWYASPRSIQIIFERLIDEGYMEKVEGKLSLKKKQWIWDFTVDIPLLWTVACGAPIFAEENIEAKIPVSVHIAQAPYKYFFLRAKGDSMNQKDIHDGDLILIREQHTANDNDIVVALIDDEATIKEFKHLWDSIALIPHSDNPKHKPIILQEDFLIQWLFVKAFPSSIF